MAGVVDINKDRVKCEVCDCFYTKEQIYGYDEDGNPVCQICIDKLDSPAKFDDEDFENLITGDGEED